MGLARYRWMYLIVFAVAIFSFAAASHAQDAAPATAPATAPAADSGGGGAGGMSSAEMFFWSGDWLGRIVTWGLIIMSIATIALVIHYILQNRRETIVPEEAVMEIEGLLADRKFRDAIEVSENEPSIFGEIMHAALSEASNGYGAMERAVEETSDLASARRIRSIEILNVFGAVGPMLGLFGTVYGMIVAFQTIVNTQGKASPSDLAAGISTALVTTFWGLIVGIPAVAAAALVRNRIDSLITETMVEAESLIGRFRPGGGSKKSSSDKSSPASPKPKAE